jgi:hypothetical protein
VGHWLRLIVVVAVIALSTGACGSATGIAQGRVLVFGPVPHPGVTTTLPVARFSSTVEAKSAALTVARDKVPPGAQFHFVLAPGAYVLSVAGVPFCRAQIKIVAGRTSQENVRCVEP